MANAMNLTAMEGKELKKEDTPTTVGIFNVKVDDPEKLVSAYLAYKNQIKGSEVDLVMGLSVLDMKYKVMAKRILPLIDSAVDDQKTSFFYVVFDPSGYQYTLENIECILKLIESKHLKFVADNGAGDGPQLIRLSEEERQAAVAAEAPSEEITSANLLALMPAGKWKEMCDANEAAAKPAFLFFDRIVNEDDINAMAQKTNLEAEYPEAANEANENLNVPDEPQGYYEEDEEMLRELDYEEEDSDPYDFERQEDMRFVRENNGEYY